MYTPTAQYAKEKNAARCLTQYVKTDERPDAMCVLFTTSFIAKLPIHTEFKQDQIFYICTALHICLLCFESNNSALLTIFQKKITEE